LTSSSAWLSVLWSSGARFTVGPPPPKALLLFVLLHDSRWLTQHDENRKLHEDVTVSSFSVGAVGYFLTRETEETLESSG
jgi:hypothetical protein